MASTKNMHLETKKGADKPTTARVGLKKSNYLSNKTKRLGESPRNANNLNSTLNSAQLGGAHVLEPGSQAYLDLGKMGLTASSHLITDQPPIFQNSV
jgi:hypothetical protein